MNKAELLKELEFRLGSKEAALAALEAVTETIIREVVRGEKVSITGFGVFERVERAARVGRNPKAGVAVKIPRHKAPHFRPGTAFKEYVRTPKSMPREGTGALISRADKLALKAALAGQGNPAKRLSKPASLGKRAARKLAEQNAGTEATTATTSAGRSSTKASTKNPTKSPVKTAAKSPAKQSPVTEPTAKR